MRFLPLFFLILILAGCPPVQHLATGNTSARLVVRGEATVRVVPDQVEMSLEAETSAETAEVALTENSVAIVALQELLHAEGLTSAEYETGQFSIQPQWSRPPRPAPADWTPDIVGYRVRNSLQVRTSRIELAGRLLALAQSAGVNKAGRLNFSLADPEAASQKAIAAATAKARQRAEVLAQASGVNLAGLLEAQVEDEQSGNLPRLMMAEAAQARGGVSSVPITAGDVEVHAAVRLVYRIAP